MQISEQALAKSMSEHDGHSGYATRGAKREPSLLDLWVQRTLTKFMTRQLSKRTTTSGRGITHNVPQTTCA